MEKRWALALTHTFSRWCTKLLSSNLSMLTTSSLDPQIPRLRSSLQRHQLKRLKSSLRLVSQTILWRKPLSHFNWVDHARGRRAWQIWDARKYWSRNQTARSTEGSARNKIHQIGAKRTLNLHSLMLGHSDQRCRS